MKKTLLIFIIFLPAYLFAQVSESFSDGNFTENPAWTGITTNFIVNSSLELQSSATSASVSYLFTPSEAIDNAVWQCRIRVTYTTSASNYAAVYIVSDKADVTSGCNGYYVQVGGTNDEVSLFQQKGTTKTKIIDGVDKRTDGNPVDIVIKVTRDVSGNFTLYSKLPAETEFVTEGSVQNNTFTQSGYFGLLYSNTSTTGSDFFFDDISVTGEKATDNTPPQITSFTLLPPNRIQLNFSEPIDFSDAIFTVNNGIGTASAVEIAADKTSTILTFGVEFERGIVYELTSEGIKDRSGNSLEDKVRTFGITEHPVIGDIVWNEIMPNASDDNEEYVEIANTSDKLIDLGGLIVTTRKTDGSLNSGFAIPQPAMILPHHYLALTLDAGKIIKHYHTPDTATVLSTSKWNSLNNDSASVILTNSTRDTIYDEIAYSEKWHFVLIKNDRNVSLEKINPELPAINPSSWHSAASEVYYGTPGYKNSQYRDVVNDNAVDKIFTIDPEAFSPDNDGYNDVCFIRYHTAESGWTVAKMIIFNGAGEKVSQIASNFLLGADGFFAWDGKTSKNNIADIGIYMVYIEILNINNGVHKELKIPIVVTAR